MMRLLAPLGLLGLLGVVALIIIYIIKPNYQQRFVSSTFVWKLSLKYRKRKIPINKLRNLLIIICQILILTLCAFVLSRPNEVYENKLTENEYILVVDSSASMRTEYDGITRYERALDKVMADSNRIFSEEGTISVIIADNDPKFLTTTPDQSVEDSTVEIFRQVNASKAFSLQSELEILKEDDSCYYGASDINKAMSLCQDIISENPTAKVYLYTDTTYPVSDTVEVINVNEKDEWNVGILAVEAIAVEYSYEFHVEVGYYSHAEGVEGRIINVDLYVNNTNAYDKTETGPDLPVANAAVSCERGISQKIIFKTTLTEEERSGSEIGVTYVDLGDFYGTGYNINSFSNAQISISVAGTNGDSNSLDDNYILYGNQKEIIKIQYASGLPNPFAANAIAVLERIYSSRWDIQITEIQKGKPYATEGFDWYIFEHIAPETMPTDGAVFLINPESTPAGADFSVTEVRDYPYLNADEAPTLTVEEDAEGAALNVLAGTDFNKIFITQQAIISEYSSAYEVLLSFDGSPSLMVKNTGAQKVAIQSFSPNRTNLPNEKEYMLLWVNLFQYYFPSIVSGSNVYIGETVDINVMSERLDLLYPSLDNTVRVNGDETWSFTAGTNEIGENFLIQYIFDLPGRYEINQRTYMARILTENVFVAIPTVESDIFATSTMEAPVAEKYEKEFFEDLLLYLAAALVFFLFVEWLLHVSENN